MLVEKAAGVGWCGGLNAHWRDGVIYPWEEGKASLSLLLWILPLTLLLPSRPATAGRRFALARELPGGPTPGSAGLGIGPAARFLLGSAGAT